MGVVWRATDTVLGRVVALKELRAPDGLDAAEAIDRFVTEARAAAGLSHPSIVTVHDVFSEDDRVLMSMELLEGQTLAEVIAAGGLGSAARPIMVEIASALSAAHTAGVVHRDLKPENVFLLDTGRVVVCDFGLARIGAGSGTQIGTVMGTPGYMAPEQLKGTDVSYPADIFAWGAVAYELASGTGAFGDPTVDDFASLSYRVTHEDPTPLIFEDDNTFWDVIDASLTKNPEDRLANGTALLNALNNPTTPTPPKPATPTATTPAAAATPQPAAAASRNNSVFIGVGIAITAMIALTALILVVLTGNDPQTATTTTTPPTTAPPTPTTTTVPTTTSTEAPTTTTPPAPTLPPVGPTGHPIVEGWVAFVLSDLKSVVNERALEDEPSNFVLDTDDYVTGVRCPEALRKAEPPECRGYAGYPPEYLPGPGALGAAYGPFTRAEAEDFCAPRDPRFCNPRQLIPLVS